MPTAEKWHYNEGVIGLNPWCERQCAIREPQKSAKKCQKVPFFWSVDGDPAGAYVIPVLTGAEGKS